MLDTQISVTPFNDAVNVGIIDAKPFKSDSIIFKREFQNCVLDEIILVRFYSQTPIRSSLLLSIYIFINCVTFIADLKFDVCNNSFLRATL